jgi:hypothetical protein
MWTLVLVLFSSPVLGTTSTDSYHKPSLLLGIKCKIIYTVNTTCDINRMLCFIFLSIIVLDSLFDPVHVLCCDILPPLCCPFVWRFSTSRTDGQHPGFYSYSEHYPEEEYEYSEEQEEEGVASYVPVFLTSPHTVWVSQGGRARLECRVDRLGPMVLSWSRVDRANSTYLATGAMLLVTDPRLTVELAASSSTLFITGVEARDEGEYLCQASSQPPVHVKLTLRLKGGLANGMLK